MDARWLSGESVSASFSISSGYPSPTLLVSLPRKYLSIYICLFLVIYQCPLFDFRKKHSCSVQKSIDTPMEIHHGYLWNLLQYDNSWQQDGANRIDVHWGELCSTREEAARHTSGSISTKSGWFRCYWMALILLHTYVPRMWSAASPFSQEGTGLRRGGRFFFAGELLFIFMQ